MDEKKIANLFFIICLSLIAYLVWILARPMLSAIVFGGIMAGSFLPLLKKIEARFKLKRTTAAGWTSLTIVLIVILPSIYVLVQLSREMIHAYSSIKDGLSEQAVQEFLFGQGKVAKILKDIFSIMDIDYSPQGLQEKIVGGLKFISGGVVTFVNSWVSNAMAFILDFLIMLIVIYGFFVYGPALKDYLFKLSPLPEEEEAYILEKFNQMNYVTLVCNGLAGLIQGVLGGIALWFVGVKSIILWTVTMTVLAFIPLVGISMVYIPLTIYLWLKGETLSAIFLFSFCTILSFAVEKGFKPSFIGSRVQMNSLLVLLSIIGGMKVFGVIGIFYGPLIIMVFMTFVDIYHKNYSTPLKNNEV